MNKLDKKKCTNLRFYFGQWTVDGSVEGHDAIGLILRASSSCTRCEAIGTFVTIQRLTFHHNLTKKYRNEQKMVL